MQTLLKERLRLLSLSVLFYLHLGDADFFEGTIKIALFIRTFLSPSWGFDSFEETIKITLFIRTFFLFILGA